MSTKVLLLEIDNKQTVSGDEVLRKVKNNKEFTERCRKMLDIFFATITMAVRLITTTLRRMRPIGRLHPTD